MLNHKNQNCYQDTISALKVNLRLLLQRVEKLKLEKPSYELNEKLRKIQLKVDEICDLISELEGNGEDDV